MSYSQNPNVEDTVLTIINDGDGAQCGFTYTQRVKIAKEGFGLYKFREMARNYGRYRKEHYGSTNLSRDEWVEAGNLLNAYYTEHVEEII